jgi:hypothetical protein
LMDGKNGLCKVSTNITLDNIYPGKRLFNGKW